MDSNMMPPEYANGYWYVVEVLIDPDGGKFPAIYAGDNWFAIYATVDGVEVAVVRSQVPLSSAKTLDIPVSVALEAAGYTSKPGV
jgi:hypothetical protein